MIRVLLLFILSFQTIYVVNACSCAQFPLQHKFCGSDFVIKVKVEDITSVDDSSRYEYQVDILETYRATDEAKTALNLKRLITNSFSGMCGLELQRNQVVIVGGFISDGKPNISLCDLHIQKPQDIEAQESNLRDNLPKSCVSA